MNDAFPSRREGTKGRGFDCEIARNTPDPLTLTLSPWEREFYVAWRILLPELHGIILNEDGFTFRMLFFEIDVHEIQFHLHVARVMENQ